MPTTLPYPEHQIFLALCAHLKKVGFTLESVFDGEEEPSTTNLAEAEAVVASVDTSTVWFKHAATPDRRYGVFLTAGEGTDLICDYSAPPPEKDPQGWVSAMDAFDDWITATFYD